MEIEGIKIRLAPRKFQVSLTQKSPKILQNSRF